MKRILCLLFSLITFAASSQNAPAEVSLVVSADGATKTEAVDRALRSAIEQSYGTFVSANTTILNDELVKDEIATVSSGNIQKYTEIACVTLPSGNTSVTLDVVVSITKLVSYAQSKGSECEFAGATFGANKRMYDFYKENERIAIENMIKQLDALRPVYDYEIEVKEPVLNQDGETATIELRVTVKSNEKTKLFNDIIQNTIISLSMTEEQIKPMLDAGFKYEKYELFVSDNASFNKKLRKIGKNTVYLYTDKIWDIDVFLNNVMYDFAINDNLGNQYLIIDYYDPAQNFIGHRFSWHCYQGSIPGVDTKYRSFWSYDKDGAFNTHCGCKNGGSNWGKNRTIISMNNDMLVWMLPYIQFNIPIDKINNISRINILPTKENSTNIMISREFLVSYRNSGLGTYSINYNGQWNRFGSLIYNDPNDEHPLITIMKKERIINNEYISKEVLNKVCEKTKNK